MAENKCLKEEVSTLKTDIEDLEQYGRRTSLRSPNVSLPKKTPQKSDDLIVDIAYQKLDISPPLLVNDINRSHNIGEN